MKDLWGYPVAQEASFGFTEGNPETLGSRPGSRSGTSMPRPRLCPPDSSLFLLWLLGLWSLPGLGWPWAQKELSRRNKLPASARFWDIPIFPSNKKRKLYRCREWPHGSPQDCSPQAFSSLCVAAGSSSPPPRSSLSSSLTRWGGRWLRIPLRAPITWIVMSPASYLMASRRQLQACGKRESSSCAAASAKTTVLELLFRVRQSFSQPTFQ